MASFALQKYLPWSIFLEPGNSFFKSVYNLLVFFFLKGSLRTKLFHWTPTIYKEVPKVLNDEELFLLSNLFINFLSEFLNL